MGEPRQDVGLRPGDEVRCPHCGQWHRVEQPYAKESTTAHSHLYVICRGEQYFVGSMGSISRWPMRGPSTQQT